MPTVRKMASLLGDIEGVNIEVANNKVLSGWPDFITTRHETAFIALLNNSVIKLLVLSRFSACRTKEIVELISRDINKS